MNEFVQVIIVTIVAAFALAVLVWPYVRRSDPVTPSCSHCGVARRRAHPSAVQPMTLVVSPRQTRTTSPPPPS